MSWQTFVNFVLGVWLVVSPILVFRWDAQRPLFVGIGVGMGVLFFTSWLMIFKKNRAK